jgi:hypothetical protein
VVNRYCGRMNGCYQLVWITVSIRPGDDLKCRGWAIAGLSAKPRAGSVRAHLDSPLALAMAARTIASGKSPSVGLPKSESPSIPSMFSMQASNAKSKSGAAAMTAASDRDTSPAMKTGPNWLSATMSRRVVFGLLCSRLGVCVQGLGVCCAVFIFALVSLVVLVVVVVYRLEYACLSEGAPLASLTA